MTAPFFMMHCVRIVNSSHEFQVPVEPTHRPLFCCEGIQKGRESSRKTGAPVATPFETCSNYGLWSGPWIAAWHDLGKVSRGGACQGL